MKACVLDASIALAWILPGENDANDLLEAVATDGAIVPPLWALEVGNVLLMAERRNRILPVERRRALELLQNLPIDLDTDTPPRPWSATMVLAETHRLSLYDATYLEAAIRLARPLASRDAALIRAAKSRGVPVLS